MSILNQRYNQFVGHKRIASMLVSALMRVPISMALLLFMVPLTSCERAFEAQSPDTADDVSDKNDSNNTAVVTAPQDGETSPCSVTLSSGDDVQFSTDRIQIDTSCPQFTITFEHTGQMPAQTMGHNVVISKSADRIAVADAGLNAGLENEFVQPDDPRVIVHTDIIGGGQTTSVSFDPSELTQQNDYEFYCTFPGHATVMVGEVEVIG